MRETAEPGQEDEVEGEEERGHREGCGRCRPVGHDVEDTHATATLAADGDVDGEHTGEEAGPADAARSGGGLGGGAPRVVVAAVAGEVEGELLAGGGDEGGRKDAGTEVVAAGEDARGDFLAKLGRFDDGQRQETLAISWGRPAE